MDWNPVQPNLSVTIASNLPTKEGDTGQLHVYLILDTSEGILKKLDLATHQPSAKSAM